MLFRAVVERIFYQVCVYLGFSARRYAVEQHCVFVGELSMDFGVCRLLLGGQLLWFNHACAVDFGKPVDIFLVKSENALFDHLVEGCRGRLGAL